MSVVIGLLLAAAAPIAPAAHVDWGARLRADADAFRAAVLDSHPGPVDPENPAFPALLRRAHARALERARTATSFPAYAAALDELTATFDDGHLGITADPQAEARYAWSYQWPGFVTTLRDGKHVVAIASAGMPPVGATRVGCDGQTADQLAADRIGRFVGRWMLRSRREAQGGLLFLPPDNPWLTPLRACRFDVAGRVRKVRLRWCPLDAKRRAAMLATLGLRHHSPVSLEQLPDQSFWINMGSFESDPSTPDGANLTRLNAAIADQAAALRVAPRVVFDLRGNNGGSSAWVSRAATLIWGSGPIDRLNNPAERAAWRVSDANIAQIERYRTTFAAQRATDPAPYDWAVRTAAGLTAARARGDRLWIEPAGEPVLAATDAHPVTARVFVLTDRGCGSACLDAVDVLTGLGAVQVGQETSADTLYMEVRQQVLADGAVIWVPMKAYRGRRRGSNVPAVPRHVWRGAMDDTAGLRAWIAAL